MFSRPLVRSVGLRNVFFAYDKVASSVTRLSSSETNGCHQLQSKPFSEIPTVEGWSLAETAEDQNTNYQQLLERYGPVYKIREQGGVWTIVAHGPRAVEAMYASEGRCPSRGRLFTEAIERVYEENKWRPSMAFANGQEWRRIRLAARKQATPQWAWLAMDPLHRLGVWLGDALHTGGDIRPALSHWAFKGTALFVLGDIVDIDHTHTTFMRTGLHFTRNLKSFLTSQDQNSSFVETGNTMRNLGRQIMERRYQKMKKGRETNTTLPGVLDEWTREGVFSAEEVIVHCTDLMATSFDATANTAIFLLFELAKQPSLQEQLYREITIATTHTRVTLEDLQQMRLLRDCVKETLRMYPPMAVGRRVVTMDTTISGYAIPSGTNVHATMGLMSHDPAYFDEPMRFKPERWREEKDKIQPFSCLPFGFGSRACYGRRLAELQLHTLLSTLVPRYKLSTLQQSVQVEYSSGLVAMEPVLLTLEAR